MPTRWLLVDPDDRPVGRCAEIDGLFADLPPRPRERFTLVACTPSGALAEAPTGSFLGDLSLAGSPPQWWGEDLGDVVVRGRRPSDTVPGAVDIDLDGFVHVYNRADPVRRPAGVTEFDLGNFGVCRDVTGVFREQGTPPVPVVRLLGCRPDAGLRAALDALGRASRAGHRQRHIRSDVYALPADAPAHRLIGGLVCGTVATAEPSSLGDGLVDVTIDSDVVEPLPTGMLDILVHWSHGRPTERNLWSGYNRSLRHLWAGVALANKHDGPDRPPGATYDLDGIHVTDVEGFYCAIGEAVNGPGGYFGWNLDALADCFGGGFGARAPFRLAWHHSSVAREHLAAGYDRSRLGPAVTLDYLLTMLAENHIEVDLR